MYLVFPPFAAVCPGVYDSPDFPRFPAPRDSGLAQYAFVQLGYLDIFHYYFQWFPPLPE